MNLIKSLMRNLLKKAGFQLIQLKLNLPKNVNKNYLPITLEYLLTKNGLVMEVDMHKGRGKPINSFDSIERHPFSFAAYYAKDLQLDKMQKVIYKIIKEYYELVNPKNVEQIIKRPMRINSKLQKYTYWNIVMPWENSTIDEWINHIEVYSLQENKEHNCNFGIEKGWTWIGPVSEEKLKLETKRLSKVLYSIYNNGYKRDDGHDGDINAVLLVNEDQEYVWQAIGGQHRASVLCGLGYEKILVRIHKVIRKSDAMYWPNVINGTYSLEEALNIFDMIFNAEFSHITNKWDGFVKDFKEKNG